MNARISLINSRGLWALAIGEPRRINHLTAAPLKPPFIGATLAALFLLGAGLNAPLVFLFAAMQGASLGLISILKPAVIASKLGHAAYGAISGWLAVPYLIGGALGPYIGALLWQSGGYSVALWAAVAMAALGFILTLILGRAR